MFFFERRSQNVLFVKRSQHVLFVKRSQHVLFVKRSQHVLFVKQAQMFMCLFKRKSTTFQNKTKTPREILRTTATS